MWEAWRQNETNRQPQRIGQSMSLAGEVPRERPGAYWVAVLLDKSAA